MTERPCRLVEWRPWPFENPSLIGHASFALAGGWIVHGIPVFRSAAGLSVGVPNAAQIDRESRIKLRGDGKRHYEPMLSFEGEGRERWRRMNIGALIAGGIASADELPDEVRATRLGHGGVS